MYIYIYIVRCMAIGPFISGPSQNRSININRPRPNVVTDLLFKSSACEHNPRIEWPEGILMMGGNDSVTQECLRESRCRAIFWRLAPVPMFLTSFPIEHIPYHE